MHHRALTMDHLGDLGRRLGLGHLRLRGGLLHPFTRFSRGLAFFAAGDARRVAAASIAPARAFETPSRLAILAWTALNPGCFFTGDPSAARGGAWRGTPSSGRKSPPDALS